MTDEKKKALLSVLDGMDVSEVISLLIMSGNSYSRRLLKFIKWITKWLPICIMVWHSFAMLDFFSESERNVYRAFRTLAKLHIYICVTVCITTCAHTVQ